VDEDEDQDTENMIESNWRYLPDLVLEQIFTYLTPKERYYAGLVCMLKCLYSFKYISLITY